MIPALSAWTSSPLPGATSHDRDVRRADDLDFVLANAHGLDEDDVLPRGVEGKRNVARGARQSAKVAARRHAADEDAGIAGMRLHPHAIAKDRAAGERARRVDGDDADRTARGADGRRQLVDERALAGAGRPRDADQERAAGAGKDPADEIGAGRRFVLDQ